ncbi:SRPBCC domain-containing protein [Antrihabitans sp. YC2-6]|uniref:SRPBCC family protein n=1 Tax=Antrihabitans sp. YC2-6 TaxID=2799498 RepID=UPI0018F5EAAB|nr:SRPBCC domain-containing protein [Antrihabitans sp. YC2-6]MBJ8344255.1 SRPBCC domain-containing protein [Antrihabitans sp. YC2-6]
MPEFKIQRQVVLHASPQEVFDAITAGTAGWMFPTGGDPAIDGTQPDADPVVAWEPPNKFAVRQEADGWFNALEYLIEARDGSTATLRYVHSGIFTDDWDNQYDGAGRHTDFYLHSLGQYVRHFPGRPVTYVSADGPQGSATPDGVDILRRAIGLGATAQVGDAVTFDVPGLGTIDAEVDYANDYFIGLRSADTLYRFYGRNHFGGTVDAAHHIFDPTADQEATQAAWQAWLDNVYA